MSVMIMNVYAACGHFTHSQIPLLGHMYKESRNLVDK